MPPENDALDSDALGSSYRLRKRAKVAGSSGSGVDQDEQQHPQDGGYDDLGEAYTPTRADTSTAAATKKRKRAPRGGKSQTKGSKRKAEPQPAEVEDPAGNLESMMRLPLDAIYEILRHTSPYDLLNLARTSKSFRRLLLSRSTRSVWLDAWRNDKSLPPCPDDIAPPAFAELLYDSWCHRCSTAKGEMNWSWTARARCCSKCSGHFVEKMRFTWDDIEYGFNPEQYPLWELVPEICYHAFRLEEISEFVFAWKQVPESQREEFLETRKQAMAERIRHAKLCTAWKTAFDAQKVADKRSAQLKRVESVIERLKEMGWAEMFDNMSIEHQNEFLALPDIRKDRNLTNRIINNMLPRLVTWLEMRKEVQERPLRKKMLKQRFEDLDNALLPVPADHNINPSIRDIVLNMPEARVAIDVGIDATVSFDALLAALPAYTKKWRREFYATLTKEIRFDVRNLDANLDPLALAIGAFFSCRNCPATVSLSDALSHHCGKKTGKFNRYEDFCSWTAEAVYLDAACELLAPIPEAATLRYSFSSKVPLTLTALGYDPRTATIEEMDASAARIVCPQCSTEQKKAILTWRAAALHRCWSPSYDKATEAEAAAVKAQEDAIVQNYTAERRIHCAHCPRDERRVDYTVDDLLQHATARHGIEHPSERDGFYDTTLPPICQDPVYLEVATPAAE